MVLMVHTMIGIYNLALSLCKSGVGTLSIYTIRGVNCVSLHNLGPSCLSTIHNLGFQKNEFPPCFQLSCAFVKFRYP